MSDRELLKRAAKAAGVSTKIVKPFADYDDRLGFYTMNMDGSRVTGQWNPLTDDGDALRLAVKRRFRVCVFSATTVEGVESPGFVEVWNEESDLLRVEYVKQGDYEAATRRAIVRAAAEIGRAMK